MSWNAYDINGGGGMPWGNTGGWGGTALAAGAGALVGGLLFGNGGLGGNNATKDVAVETSKQVGDLQGSMFASALAAADRGYQQTIAFNQQMSSVDRDVLTTSYDTSRQMCDGFNTSNVVALQSKYDSALQLAHLEEEQQECCCKIEEKIMCMGYETQLRDMANQNSTNIQLQEIKCLIKDTEANSIMRAQSAKICELEGRINKEEIIAAMKPVAPVPAYIQANPYENFRPVVRVDRGHHDCDHDCRWASN